MDAILVVAIAAPCFSAVATILAVTVAPYLGLREGRPRLRVRAHFKGEKTLDAFEPRGPKEFRYLVITIANIGHRPATINAISWLFGLWKRRVPLETPSLAGNPKLPVGNLKLPVKIMEGEEVSFEIVLAAYEIRIQITIQTELVGHPQLKLRLARIEVQTADGLRFRSRRFDKELRDALSQLASELLSADEAAELATRH